MNDHSYLNDVPRGGTGTGITVAGFVVGALVGAGVALLLAPGPGNETRKKLGETARRLGSAAGDAVNKGREQIGDAVSKGREQIGDAVSKGREQLSQHSEGGQGESFRTGGRQVREPLGGGRTPQAT